jgi:hypothetical protein
VLCTLAAYRLRPLSEFPGDPTRWSSPSSWSQLMIMPDVLLVENY